ncbi:tetratricopeptide repeat protein [bacterium]|nr:tetratricopeptide repeat protein [bacterium]
MNKLRNTFVAIGVACGVLAALPAWAGQLKDGISAVERKDFGRARDLLESYTKRFPNDPRPYYYLAKCYESWFQITKVDESLRTYRVLNEKRTRILLTLEGADSVPVYRAMLQDDPSDVSARMLLIVSLLQNNVGMMAMAELQALPRESVPAGLEDVYQAMWGALYQMQGNYEQARAAFKEAWRLNINHPLPAVKLAEIDRQERDQFQKQTTTVVFDQSEKADRRSFDLTFKLGKDLLDEGNFSGAIEALGQALALKADHPETKRLMGVAKQKGAEDSYQKGLAFLKEQKYAAAYDSFQEALKFDPQFAKAQFAAQDAKLKADAQEREAGNQ